MHVRVEGKAIKIGNFKRLFKTDFEPEFQDLIETLAGSLNTAIETLYDLNNKKITLRDNVACTVRDFEVIVDSTGNPTTQTNIKLDVTSQIDGLQVIRAENVTNGNMYPNGCPFISYTQNGTTVLINNIKGLQESNKWRLRVIVWQN